MAYSYNLPAAENYSELLNISDSEDVYSISDDESVAQEANNRRLTQAINYLQQEGGDDSPTTFIDRINRINETLLGRLAQQGRKFDPMLYRQVRALVIDVGSDYDNAAQEESLDLDSDEDLAEIYTPTAYDDVEALYRGGSPDSDAPSPTPAPRARRTSKALAPRRPGLEDKLERERDFTYGGPGENELWYRDFPASLPFPETLMMAHWESLKIDYDLDRPKDAATVETIVPLEHEQIQPYFELPQYESGSRFKLPHVGEEDHIAIQKLGTAVHLAKVVNKFFEVDQTDGGKLEYAPRLFLEKFQVGHQWTPNQYLTPEQIRSSLSSSPTKPRTTTTGTAPSMRSSPPLIEGCIYDTNSDTALHPTLEKPQSSKSRTTQRAQTPAFRRISKEVRCVESEDELVHPRTFSTRPKDAVTQPATFSTRPKATTTRVASHVEIPKKRPGRPRKTPLPAVAVQAKEPVDSTIVISPDCPRRPNPSSSKRKPSIGSRPYETPRSSIKKVLRDKKKRKLSEVKSVEFVEAPIVLEEDSEDPNYPASPVNRPTRVGSGSKAAGAGKLNKGKKTAGETRGRMTTRSGAS